MWPVGGAALVRGEVLAPAAILIGIAWLCGVGGLIFGSRLDVPPTYAMAAMLVAPGIICVQLLVQNAIAVMWPSWAMVGSHRARGIDVMGQRLIMMFGMMIVLVIAALPAALAAVLVGFALYWATGAVHILLPAIVASAGLLVESYIGSAAIGKILERTDVGQIDAAEN
jgi:hypothetical protein